MEGMHDDGLQQSAIYSSRLQWGYCDRGLGIFHCVPGGKAELRFYNHVPESERAHWCPFVGNPILFGGAASGYNPLKDC